MVQLNPRRIQPSPMEKLSLGVRVLSLMHLRRRTSSATIPPTPAVIPLPTVILPPMVAPPPTVILPPMVAPPPTVILPPMVAPPPTVILPLMVAPLPTVILPLMVAPLLTVILPLMVAPLPTVILLPMVIPLQAVTPQLAMVPLILLLAITLLPVIVRLPPPLPLPPHPDSSPLLPQIPRPSAHAHWLPAAPAAQRYPEATQAVRSCSAQCLHTQRAPVSYWLSLRAWLHSWCKPCLFVPCARYFCWTSLLMGQSSLVDICSEHYPFNGRVISKNYRVFISSLGLVGLFSSEHLCLRASDPSGSLL